MFIVERNCCTSGNCITCTRKTPFGKPIRIEQARYADKAKAERVRDGWREYDAKIVEREAR